MLLALIVLIFSLLFVQVRYVEKSWGSPASLATIYWSVFVLASLLMLSSEYEWNYGGMFWIIGSCFIFGIGHFFGRLVGSLIKGKQDDKKSESTGLTPLSWQFIAISTVLGSARGMLELIQNGFSLSMFFDLESLIAMNVTSAQQRYYGGGLAAGAFVQILLIFNYVSPLMGGYASNYASGKYQKLLCFSTFLPVLLSILMTNAKAGFIASVFLWISGYLVSFIAINRRVPFIRLPLLMKTIFTGALVLTLLYLTMMFRIGDLSLKTQQIVAKKIVVYALGHMASFDDWFSQDEQKEFTYGTYTFYGPASALGVAERKQGVYTEFMGVGSNVFTVFRGFIHDYGKAGSLFFLMLTGFFAGFSYQSIFYSGTGKVFHLTVVASVFFFIFYSMIISSWTYMSFVFVFPVFFVYLWLSSTKFRIVPASQSCD